MGRLLATLLFLLLATAIGAVPATAAEAALADAAPGAGPATARLAPGEPLGREIVAGLVETELRERGAGDRFEIVIDAPGLPLPNHAGQPAALTLEGLRHEPRGGRFTAALRVRLESGETSVVELSGRAREVVKVPVPARQVARGEVVAAEDLEGRWLPSASLQPDALRDPEDLVGREARRVLPAGRAVRAADLVVPRLVARGEAVTMVYTGGGLEVSTLGEALDHGGLGAVVRVANAGTSLVRKGVVVGPRRVRVGADAGSAVP